MKDSRQDREAGVMAAILGAVDTQEVRRIAQENGIDVANLNSPTETIISGNRKGVEQALEAISGEKIRKMMLLTSDAFHSRLVAPAVPTFTAAFEDVHFSNATMPVYVNSTGEPTRSGEVLKAVLPGEIAKPVLWLPII